MNIAKIHVKAISVLLALFAVSLLPGIAFASNVSVASDDDDEECYIDASDLKTADIDIAYASYDSLPLWFIMSGFENEDDEFPSYYDDELVAKVYLKSPGGKFKKVKTLIFDEEFEGHRDGYGNYFGNDLYLDEDEYEYDDDDDTGLPYDFKIKNLKPATKYTVRIDCKTTGLGLKRTIKRTFTTAYKPITNKQISKKGPVYTWAKAKKAKGYLVHYKKAVDIGKNEYGVNCYEWRYRAKFVSKPSIKLDSYSKIVKVMPYTKYGKCYYFHKSNLMKSKTKIAKQFKAVSITYYY